MSFTTIAIDLGPNEIAVTGSFRDGTTAELEARVKKPYPNAIRWKKVKPQSLPSATFRDAWRIDGNGDVTVDMDVARQIASERFQAEADQRLEDTQQGLLDALAGQDNAARGQIAQQRVNIRSSLQQALGQVQSAQTPQELEDITFGS